MGETSFSEVLEALLQQGLLYDDEVFFLRNEKGNDFKEFSELFCARFENERTKVSSLFSLFQYIAQYHCIKRGETMESIDIEGLLDVKVDGKWKNRFFVLQGFALESYECIGDIKPKDTVVLSPDLFIRDLPKSLNRSGFEIVGSRECILFSAINDDAALQWVVSVCRAVVAPRLMHLKAPLAFVATPVDIKQQLSAEIPIKIETEEEERQSKAAAARASFEGTPKSPFMSASPSLSQRKSLRLKAVEKKSKSKAKNKNIEDINLASTFGVRISGHLRKATIRSSRDEKLNSHKILNRLLSTIQSSSPSFRLNKKSEIAVQTEDENSESIADMIGASSKGGKQTMPKMKNRYFVLENNLLSYYSSRKHFEDGLLPQGQLFLPSDCTVIRDYEGKMFDVITARRTLRLQASSIAEKLKWVDEIENVLIEGKSKQTLYESFRFGRDKQMKNKKRRPRKSLLPISIQRPIAENEEKCEIWVTKNMKSGEKIGEVVYEKGSKPVEIRKAIYNQLGDQAPVKFAFCRKQEGIQSALAKVAFVRLSLIAPDGKLPMDDPEEKKGEDIFSNIYTKMTRSQENEDNNPAISMENDRCPVIVLYSSCVEDRSRQEMMEEMRKMQARIAELERALAESMRNTNQGAENALSMSAIAAALYRLQNDGYLALDLSIADLAAEYENFFHTQDLGRLFLNSDSPLKLVFQKMGHDPKKIRQLVDNIQKLFIDYNLFGSRISSPWWKRQLQHPKLYRKPETLFEWAKKEPWVEDEIERSFYLTTKQRGKKLKKQQTFVVRPKPAGGKTGIENKENTRKTSKLRVSAKDKNQDLPKALLERLNRIKAAN